MKIRHGKFSDCRSLGASIEVVIRSGSVGQEMFNGDLIQPVIHENTLQYLWFQHGGDVGAESQCLLLDQLHGDRCGCSFPTLAEWNGRSSGP